MRNFYGIKKGIKVLKIGIVFKWYCFVICLCIYILRKMKDSIVRGKVKIKKLGKIGLYYCCKGVKIMNGYGNG